MQAKLGYQLVACDEDVEWGVLLVEEFLQEGWDTTVARLLCTAHNAPQLIPIPDSSTFWWSSSHGDCPSKAMPAGFRTHHGFTTWCLPIGALVCSVYCTGHTNIATVYYYLLQFTKTKSRARKFGREIMNSTDWKCITKQIHYSTCTHPLGLQAVASTFNFCRNHRI